MSRQYLKDLQHRAQLLLEASSDQQDEINAYTASPSKSRPTPRIDLQNLVQHSQSDSEDEDANYNRPDIQLLKKCIALTNQNNSLKLLVEQQQNKINNFEKVAKEQGRTKNVEKVEYGAEKVDPKKIMRQNSEKQKEIQQLLLQNKQLVQQNSILKTISSQLQRQLESTKIKLVRETPKVSQQIDIQNDYTIKYKNQSLQNDTTCQEKEFRDRIKRYEGLLREQKGKCRKLSQFINSEIPKLQNIIQQLTVKLQLRVDKYLLRDSPHL